MTGEVLVTINVGGMNYQVPAGGEAEAYFRAMAALSDIEDAPSPVDADRQMNAVDDLDELSIAHVAPNVARAAIGVLDEGVKR